MLRLPMALVLTLTFAGHAQAQLADRRFANQDSARAPNPPILRVGKWVTLGAAAGAAAWAVTINGEADRRYDDLETLCEDTPGRCRRTGEDGPFQDASLEAEYQSILDLDHRSERVLLAAQLGILTSLALFILDLPRGGSPESIPYTPPRLEHGRFRLWLLPRVSR